MKKITVIMNWLRSGGAEKNTIKIVNHLSLNNDVTLIVMSNKYCDLISEISQGVKVIVGMSLINLFFYYVKAGKSIDIIFSGDHRVAAYLTVFRCFRPFDKNKYWCRSINNLTVLLSDKKKIIKSLLKIVLSKQDLVIAQCLAMKNDLVANWGVDDSACIVVYNPIDTTISQIDRASLSKDSRGFTFLYIGRFSKQKRLPLMVESFAKARLPHNVKLCLVGYRSWMSSDCEELKKIHDIASYYSIDERIEINPWTNNSGEYFKHASCFLLTSAFEGFPNVLVESINHGVPIVSVKCDFGPEEIINNINGILVESSTVKNIAESIENAYHKKWSINDIYLSSLKFSKENQFVNIDRRIS
ncbi:glycosyltransferase [Aeromonas salmonicida subsp. pectinolytica]